MSDAAQEREGGGAGLAGLFGVAATRDPAETEFQFLAQLLWNAAAAAPAMAVAAVLRALGLRTVSTATGPQMSTMVDGGTMAASFPAGTVVDSLAWAEVKLVGEPGQR